MTDLEMRVLRRAIEAWWPEGEWIDPALGLKDYMAFKFRLVLEAEEGFPLEQAQIIGRDMVREVIGPDPDDGWRLWDSLEELRALAVQYVENHKAEREEDSETETSE